MNEIPISDNFLNNLPKCDCNHCIHNVCSSKIGDECLDKAGYNYFAEDCISVIEVNGIEFIKTRDFPYKKFEPKFELTTFIKKEEFTI